MAWRWDYLGSSGGSRGGVFFEKIMENVETTASSLSTIARVLSWLWIVDGFLRGMRLESIWIQFL
jgi:hypothetical protein